MKCLAAHIARAFLLTATIFCRLVGMNKGYKRSKFQPNRRQISELLRVKILDIPHQLWTAYLSQMRPSPIGMKPVPDERPGAMSHWGNWTKILRASFSSSGR